MTLAISEAARFAISWGITVLLIIVTAMVTWFVYQLAAGDHEKKKEPKE